MTSMFTCTNGFAQLLTFSEVSQSEDYSAGHRKSSSAKNSKASPKKKKVQSDDEGGPTADTTNKYDDLPDWVKPDVRTLIVPSLKELVGMQDEGPWLLDLPTCTFLQRLQALIDDVFPERHHNLTVQDPIYDWVCFHFKTVGVHTNYHVVCSVSNKCTIGDGLSRRTPSLP